jgi:hypothetical protein
MVLAYSMKTSLNAMLSTPRLTNGSTGAAESSFEWLLSVLRGGPVNRSVSPLQPDNDKELRVYFEQTSNNLA